MSEILPAYTGEARRVRVIAAPQRAAVVATAEDVDPLAVIVDSVSKATGNRPFKSTDNTPRASEPYSTSQIATPWAGSASAAGANRRTGQVVKGGSATFAFDTSRETVGALVSGTSHKPVPRRGLHVQTADLFISNSGKAPVPIRVSYGNPDAPEVAATGQLSVVTAADGSVLPPGFIVVAPKDSLTVEVASKVKEPFGTTLHSMTTSDEVVDMIEKAVLNKTGFKAELPTQRAVLPANSEAVEFLKMEGFTGFQVSGDNVHTTMGDIEEHLTYREGIITNQVASRMAGNGHNVYLEARGDAKALAGITAILKSNYVPV